MLRSASSAQRMDIGHKRWSWFSGNLELDMTGGPGTLSRRETSINQQRRIA